MFLKTIFNPLLEDGFQVINEDVIKYITSVQTDLIPGIYDLNGIFDITLSNEVGEWRFYNSSNNFETSNVTFLISNSQDYVVQGVATSVPFVADVNGKSFSILRTELNGDYKVFFEFIPTVDTSNPITSLDGVNVTNTLTQLTGATWLVNTATSSLAGQINLNTNFANYIQEGNKRYYSLRFFCDVDPAFSFGVTGAIDVALVSGNGFSQTAGDVANRMVQIRRSGVNVITVDRDDDNNADLFIDISFMAIMP